MSSAIRSPHWPRACELDSTLLRSDVRFTKSLTARSTLPNFSAFWSCRRLISTSICCMRWLRLSCTLRNEVSMSLALLPSRSLDASATRSAASLMDSSRSRRDCSFNADSASVSADCTTPCTEEARSVEDVGAKSCCTVLLRNARKRTAAPMARPRARGRMKSIN